ncbi:GNAT family N-acetyltransferase [Roseibium sp. RKSG952]|uniref:GNAT family N-acetyltransferase n=1 Tax=Roseibium sp. RKSG952 TaxID=2529384 RepID=UPI0012BBF147|nr:GNAT family N-acetyltransferase [Roseibium sp. RKSG952]MTH98427.1 N-acetyltransferase [Roseibium sp. RKSG952]
MASIELDLEGYTDLPAGKLAFIVTYLQMLEKPAGHKVPDREDVRLERWHVPDPEAYLSLFKAIGEDWLWFGRLVLSRDELVATLHEPTREVYAALQGGKPVGLLELDYSDAGQPEIAYFGITPEKTGSGLGRWLMAHAIAIAWSKPETARLWLHTCTGDSPQALGFYQHCGFVPYKRAIEVAGDPRLQGLLPAGAGRHIPVL